MCVEKESEEERKSCQQFQIHSIYVCCIKIMSTCYVDTSTASLSKCMFWGVGECTDKSFLSIILHAVHGVVWHQSKRWHFSWYTGWREHAADVGGRVNVLAVLHLVCRALPVDMEAGDTGVGGQNIPLELRE